MFSLIIVLISIVLVAGIAIATIFYGGRAASQSSANAEAAALLAQSAQIASASAAFTIDNAGRKPDSLEQLLDGKYLSSIPIGWQDPESSATPITSKVIQSENACLTFNLKQGIEGIPLCSEITSLTSPVCCQ